MKFYSRIAFAGLVLACAFLFTACPQRTSIADLKRDPARYNNKEVAVSGRVTDSYGVFGRGAYEIDDNTGRLWVATESGVPERGARIGAKGRLLNGLNIAGRNFGIVLREKDRRQRK